MERAREKPRLLLGAAAAAAAAALFVAWIGLEVGGARTTLWVDDLATPLAAAIACASCVRAGARQRGRMRLFWALLAGATACWTLAEVVWALYALALDVEVPVPSWADVGYLSAIALTVAGLLAHPGTQGNSTRKARAVLDGVVIATALLFLSWMLVLGPLWRGSDLGTWSGVVSVAYPFGDVVIVFFIVLAIRGMTGADRLSLWCLLAALLAMALSDSAYTYSTEVASYSSARANLLDAGWVVAYLGIALAALWSGAGERPARPVARSRPSLASLLSPLLPVLVALVATAVEDGVGDHFDHVALLMALALIGLVLARQGVLLGELLGPAQRPGAALRTRLRHVALRGGPVAHAPASPYRHSGHDRL
jgi:hypothetical protein